MNGAIRSDTHSSHGQGHLMSRLDRQLLYNDSGNIAEFADAIKEALRILEHDRNLDQLYFFGLKLMVRVFGEAALEMRLGSQITGWSTESNIDSLLRGGWLRRLSERTVMVARKDVHSNKRPLRAGDSLNALSSGTRKLLTHFLPRSDFLRLLVSTGRKVNIPLIKFPAKVQICILQRPYYDLVRSPNQKVYFPPYFKVRSHEQYQPLLKNNESDRALALDFYEAYLIAILRFPKDYPYAFEPVDIRRSSINKHESNSYSSSPRRDAGSMNGRSSMSKYPERSGGMSTEGASVWNRSPRPLTSSSSSSTSKNNYSGHLGSRAGYDQNRNPQTPNQSHTIPSPSASTFRQPVPGYGDLPGFIVGQLQEFLQESPLMFLNKFGLHGWTDGSPYLCLLQEVLIEFVPHAAKDNSYSDYSNGYGNDRNNRRGSSAGARSVSPQRKRESLSSYDDATTSGFGRNQSPPGRNGRRGSTTPTPSAAAEYDTSPYIGAGVKLSTEGEMFLKMLADFWIDVALLVRRNHAQGAREKSKLTKQVEHYHHQYRHPSPLEVMTLDNSSVEWRESTLQCIYLTLVRVLSDPSLCTQYSNILESNGRKSMGQTRNRQRGGYSSNKYNIVSEGNSPKTMHILQQPLFDMLRCIFSKSHLQGGDSNRGASRNQHALAIEIWLCYIQPWKASAIASGIPLEKINQDPSRYSAVYTKKWKPYIASNLHFYTTLLVMFIEMMSKMELSTVEDVGLMHLYLLEKVLMPFEAAPSLMEDIKGLVEDMKKWYPSNCRVNNPPMPMTLVGASFEDTHGSSNSLNGGNGITPDLPYLVAMRIQHQLLYEDASIDRVEDGYSCGIVSPQEYCSGDGASVKAIQKVMSSLRLAIKETERHRSHFQWLSLQSWSSILLVPCAEIFDLVVGTPYFCHHYKLSNKYTASYWISKLAPTTSAGDTAMRKRLEEAREGLKNMLDCGISASNDEGAEGGLTPLYNQTQSSENIINKDGKLTPQGKKYLNAGQRIPAELLRRHEDVLFRAPYGHEVPFVALFFIMLSERLNQKYDLPLFKEAGRWTWERIVSEVRSYESPPEQHPVVGKLHKLQQYYRFNLRFLASIRVVSVFALCLLYGLNYSRLGWFYYTSVLHVLIAMYYNSNVALPGAVYLSGMGSVVAFIVYITFFYCL